MSLKDKLKNCTIKYTLPLISLFTPITAPEPVLSQQVEQKEEKTKIIIDREEYTIQNGFILKKGERIPIGDEDLIYKILETQEVLEDVKLLASAKKQLEPYIIYATLQERVMKHSAEIEYALTVPAKIISNLLINGFPDLSDITLTQDMIMEAAEEIANNPQGHLKRVAHKYFSTALKKLKWNLELAENVEETGIFSDEMAHYYHENAIYSYIYLQSANALYGDALKITSLEERWKKEFIEAVVHTIPPHLTEVTEKILDEDLVEILINRTDKKLMEFEAYKKFKERIEEYKEKCDKTEKEKEERLRELAKRYVSKKERYHGKDEIVKERSVGETIKEFYDKIKDFERFNTEIWVEIAMEGEMDDKPPAWGIREDSKDFLEKLENILKESGFNDLIKEGKLTYEEKLDIYYDIGFIKRGDHYKEIRDWSTPENAWRTFMYAVLKDEKDLIIDSVYRDGGFTWWELEEYKRKKFPQPNLPQYLKMKGDSKIFYIGGYQIGERATLHYVWYPVYFKESRYSKIPNKEIEYWAYVYLKEQDGKWKIVLEDFK